MSKRTEEIRERHRGYVHESEDERDSFQLLEYDIPWLLDRVEKLEEALRRMVDGTVPSGALLTDSETDDG